MNGHLLAERVSAMIPGYEKIFAERGGITPSDPLEFHLYHLARYWSRLVGFCRQDPSKSAAIIDTDLGACVEVGSEFAHKLIGPSSPIHERWQEYWRRTQAILHERPVTIEDVEAASRAFNECLAELKYDPWVQQGYPANCHRAMSKRSSDWYIPPDWLWHLSMLIVLPCIVVLAGMLLPLVAQLKRADIRALYGLGLGAGVIGAVLLFVARLSLYKQRRFWTIGPMHLDRKHRRIYWLAYAFVVVSLLLGVVWLRTHEN